MTKESSTSNDDSDAYIADALQNMTLQERDSLYHELHGVADVVHETSGFLKECFRKLRFELQKTSTHPSGMNVRAFLVAEHEDFSYVHSKFHYKAFLRAERFDAKAAAIRMIRFFEFKSQAFGFQNLCKDITQDMLSEEDLQAYQEGVNQVLPCRDKMGRCICVMFPNLASVLGTPDRMVRTWEQ